MVRAGHAAEAAAYAHAHPELSVGLHVDLYEWHYTGEAWIAAYEVVPTGDEAAIGAEVAAQVERFCSLMGREPTHLDAHQHAHREEPARSVVLEHGKQPRRAGPQLHARPALRGRLLRAERTRRAVARGDHAGGAVRAAARAAAGRERARLPPGDRRRVRLLLRRRAHRRDGDAVRSARARRPPRGGHRAALVSELGGRAAISRVPRCCSDGAGRCGRVCGGRCRR